MISVKMEIYEGEGQEGEKGKKRKEKKRILNCINDGNWNKMFACNIFGSEGSYLMGEV